MIDATRAITARPFNVKMFVHERARADAEREQRRREALRPLFNRYGAELPNVLISPYASFNDDDDMLAMLVETAPAVVIFHFGVPSADRIAALRRTGCVLLASATCLAEARMIEAAGIDIVVAQGWEAGGHRGVFDPSAPDDQLGTMALACLLITQTRLPVLAAGGIMDGAGIRAALDLGAVAV